MKKVEKGYIYFFSRTIIISFVCKRRYSKKTIQKEIGIVFAKVLEDAGVYKRTDEGKAAFKRFIESL